MENINNLFDAKIEECCAVTVGKFDGIHKGHELLMENVIKQKSLGLSSCIVTFLNSPRIELGKDVTPSLITNEEHKFMLASQGVDYLIECPFDKKIMETSPEDFIKLLVNNLHMKYLSCGSDFRFGYKGSGDVSLLEELSKEYDFKLEVIDKIQKEDRDISSTYIREELVKGNISLVNDMLGYKYFVWGKVVHGAHLGHTIGIPTINLLPPSNKLVPRFGVYVTTIEVAGRKHYGVTNVGMKPTVSNSKQIGIETNIFDFDEDIYDEEVKVIFHEFLRPEQKFSSVEELKNQMNQDKKRAFNYFNQ